MEKKNPMLWIQVYPSFQYACRGYIAKPNTSLSHLSLYVNSSALNSPSKASYSIYMSWWLSCFFKVKNSNKARCLVGVSMIIYTKTLNLFSSCARISEYGGAESNGRKMACLIWIITSWVPPLSYKDKTSFLLVFQVLYCPPLN